MIDWLWDHEIAASVIAFLAGFILSIYLLSTDRIRAYTTLPGFGAWRVGRRPSGHLEICLGRMVITGEPE